MRRWLVVSITATAATFAAALYVRLFLFDQVPPSVPIHWGIDGSPDDWRPKEEAWMNFWLAPAVQAGMIGLMFVLPWLSPRQFEVDRFRGTFEYVLALCVLLFGYIEMLLLWLTMYGEASLGKGIIAGILLFLALLGNVLGKVRRNFWMGIRTPWTLASEQVWNRTHRLAGWLFVGFGIVSSIGVLLGLPFLWAFAGLIVVALSPVLYSLYIYKQLEKQGKV